ncbi:hypothetical protein RIR_jg41811.t1 [Rhizophagus irregularis DAOM 181602=DAOM 197198]|nr:hypothetical protein RIR_jg41811.t1 [Rhizophagus irregularis DAOM 181602=DAOM 197198]
MSHALMHSHTISERTLRYFHIDRIGLLIRTLGQKKNFFSIMSESCYSKTYRNIYIFSILYIHCALNEM